jgi:hypothetical protein
LAFENGVDAPVRIGRHLGDYRLDRFDDFVVRQRRPADPPMQFANLVLQTSILRSRDNLFTTAGRYQRALRHLCMRIGVDLGGTKIESIALGADGAMLARHRVATPVGDYGATLDAVAGLVGPIERQVGGPGQRRRRNSRRDLIKNRPESRIPTARC